MVFDASLRKDLGRSFGATLVVILVIVITSFLVRALNQAAGGDIAPQDVALLLGYAGLQHLATLLSLSLFVAVVGTLTRLYRDSEMVIWRSSGLSLRRFLAPLLHSALPVLTAIAALSLLVWPWANGQVSELRERYQRRSDLARVAPGQFQASPDGRRVFFVEGGEDNRPDALARNVFVLERKDGQEVLTTARRGHLETLPEGRFVVLEQGQRHQLNLQTGERQVAAFERYRVLAGDSPLAPHAEPPLKARSTLALLQAPPLPRVQAELVWRLGLPLAAVNLVLLGVGLAGGNPRRGGSWHLLSALLAFVVYYNLLIATQNAVAGGRLGAGAALLGLHGGVFLAALLLLRWRDQGLPRLGWRRRSALIS